MTLSMTGYGRGLKSTSEYAVTIDIKSVNHRYLDLNFRIPKNYAFLEERLRRELVQALSRGKIDILVNVESFLKANTQIELNRPLVTAYLKSIAELKNDYNIPGEVDIQTILTLPDVLLQTQAEEDQETVFQIAKEALDEAIQMLLGMRQKEGEKLTEDLQNRITSLSQLRSKILVQAQTVVPSYRDKLLKRLDELTDGIELDPSRIAMEAAIFADKSDINEELVRIKSHLEQFLQTLSSIEPIGRRLDFIIQELYREINTVGSKANDLIIAQIVIDFKSELEKLREQVQNIE